MVEVIHNIPRLYTAIAEWGACIVFIILLKNKMQGIRLYIYSGFVFFIQCVLLVTTNNLSPLLWLVIMFLAVMIIFFFLLTTCEVSIMTVGNYCIRAFMLAELAASLEWQLNYFLIFHKEIGGQVLEITLLIVVFIIVFFIAYRVEKSFLELNHNFEINKRELIFTSIIALVTFTFSNLSFVYRDSPFSGNFATDIFNIRTLADIGGVILLYAYQDRISNLYMELELSAINAALRNQYDHYLHYQESINTINMKYHDLKHQITGLRAESDPLKRKVWLDEMEKELEFYEASYKTGNSVLDTILSGKILFCKKNKIDVTCVADGKLLDNIHVIDICTIFGNILDNAIESVIVSKEQEKRLIHLTVSKKREFIFIQVGNYCENELIVKNNYPVTTKADKSNHGFGMKSILHTINKYDGTLTFGVKDHWFTINILMPLEQQKF